MRGLRENLGTINNCGSCRTIATYLTAVVGLIASTSRQCIRMIYSTPPPCVAIPLLSPKKVKRIGETLPKFLGHDGESLRYAVQDHLRRFVASRSSSDTHARIL